MNSLVMVSVNSSWNCEFKTLEGYKPHLGETEFVSSVTTTVSHMG